MQDSTRKEYAWDQKLHVSRGACRQVWLLTCTVIVTELCQISTQIERKLHDMQRGRICVPIAIMRGSKLSQTGSKATNAVKHMSEPRCRLMPTSSNCLAP